MTTHILSFAKIILLQENLAEVIVNEGVEMNLKIVEEYHNFLLKELTHPFSLLINKLNSYTYTFQAQKELATLSQINAMAVLSYSKATEIVTQNLARMPREILWKLEIFTNREAALLWLQEQ